MWVSCLFCVFLAWCCSFQARAFEMLENLERADKDSLCGLWRRKWVAPIIGMFSRTDIAPSVEQPLMILSVQTSYNVCTVRVHNKLCAVSPLAVAFIPIFISVWFFARVANVLVSTSIHAHMACSSMEACGSSVYRQRNRITVNRKERSKANNGRLRVNTPQGHCRKWKNESWARRVLSLRH